MLHVFLLRLLSPCLAVLFMQTRKCHRANKKGFLRIIFNDNERVYETSTKNIVKKTLNINRMRYQATEIFKTSNNLNSSFVKGIFLIRERPNNITFKSYNTAMYGDNSLTTLDIIIGNSLSTNIKPGSSYST